MMATESKTEDRMEDDSSRSRVGIGLGLTTLLQHLQELADRMKHGHFPFQDKDVSIVESLAKVIQQLDEERKKVHSFLETETINSSILRHQLQFFPGSVYSEISFAVQSARQSNADELNVLQEKLQALNQDISRLDEHQRKLTRQNAILHPERDMVRTQHEEVISQLNQRMADKASKQIALNETRDELRDANQKIVDLETGIMILKEDMIQERADARREKKHLKQCVHDTTKKTKRQKEANMAKKKELDILKEELVVSENELSDIRKIIRRHEANKARYENQQYSFQDQLDREQKENADLKERGFELGNQLLHMEKQHLVKKSQLEQGLMELDIEMTQTHDELDELEQKWHHLKEEIEEASENQEISGCKVRDLDNVLQTKKEDLTMKANETARMKQENDEMELRMKQLEENHQVTVQLLGKQINDYRDILTRERKERFDLQEKRDKLTREIDDFKLAFGKFMSEMNQRINHAKHEQEDLSNEGALLQKDLHTDLATTQVLHTDVGKLTETFNSMINNLDTSISTLQQRKHDLEQVLLDKHTRIKDITPSYDQLEMQFEERTKDYEDKKKSVVSLKNQKNSLEDATARGKREIVKLSNPSVVLRQELKHQRTRALSKMKEQAKEHQQIEENIFKTGKKLTTVMQENDKFKKGINKLEGECDSIVQQNNINSALKGNLTSELILQRDRLVEGWEKEKLMQKESSGRDRILLDDITDLQKRTDKREQNIAHVTERLHNELIVLAHFLTDVADRRPKNTRHGRKTLTDSRPPTMLEFYLESRQQLALQSSHSSSEENADVKD
ncbi:coiled-coil domain-containing protein 175-like isoform X2 [Acanthaster planci]|uniref:Coiled-coil domain-containing protein 175-like isoform X2 n=1 Tax=Acanthaster planci TaxID=133434 RepID=A0A8B7ZR38_ACAPL|nr:coiled-coil domain-containing protein 175-like isoform X2 [Acanthaster planci]